MSVALRPPKVMLQVSLLKFADDSEVRWLALLVVRAPSANGTGNQIYASAIPSAAQCVPTGDSIQSMRLDIEAIALENANPSFNFAQIVRDSIDLLVELAQ